jgi:hypothetical protein
LSEDTKTETETTETETTETADEETAPRTFSQAELDKIVQDRVARERKKYEGHDELRAKAEEYDKLQEANRSELEKAQARAEKAEAEAAEVRAEAQATRIRSTLLAEASKAERKIVDPEGALVFLEGADSDLLERDEAGNPANIAQAFDALLEKRPYLVAPEEKARPGAADQGARGGGVKQASEAEYAAMTPTEKVEARKSGRLTSIGIAP